ncbi:MAG: Putrescine aminotransferase [Turneriella sp.]|nr:Putrescine aminotransferase [Turneriella sp.]
MPETEKQNKKQIKTSYKKYVARYKAEFFEKYRLDIVMDKRQGIYFSDLEGKKYLNCHCNGGVFNLGHRNPQVISAVTEALQNYDIGNHHFISGPKALLAEKINESINASLPQNEQETYKTIFGVSGGEAMDLAIKIARGFTKKSGVISIVGGYHGHTGLAMSAGEEKYSAPFNTRMPDFKQIEHGNIDALKNAIDENTACFILETIPATLGMPIFSRQYMKAVRKLCDEKNILLILDEIQTGLGRTGKIWCFQHYKILPDIFITGKGLSGGIYPITATCFREKFEVIFKNDPFIHISTFGGSEIGCFAAMKVIEIASDKDFLSGVSRHADYLKSEFELLAAKYDFFIECRQIGLFMGLVFKDKPTCWTFLKALADSGVFAVYANNDPKVLQFLPPLIMTDAEVLELVNSLKTAFEKMKSIKYRVIKGIISIL